MNNSVEKVYRIEDQAATLEREYQDKIEEIKAEHNQAKARLTEEHKEMLTAYQEAQDQNREQELSQYRAQLDQDTNRDQEAMRQKVREDHDHLVNIVVREVVKQYGHS